MDRQLIKRGQEIADSPEKVNETELGSSTQERITRKWQNSQFGKGNKSQRLSGQDSASVGAGVHSKESITRKEQHRKNLNAPILDKKRLNSI